MTKKYFGLKKKVLVPLLFSLAIAPSLNIGSELNSNYRKENIEKYLRIKSKIEKKVLETKFSPYSLEKNYLSGKEIKKYLQTHKNLIPEEFNYEDIQKIIEIESSFNKNAYREDYRKIKRPDGTYKKDTLRQAGLMQVTENTYNSFEKNIPYNEGAFSANKNIEVGLKNLRLIRNYNSNFNPYWQTANTADKQKYLIAGHNWGIGSLKKNNWDLNNAPDITKKFFEKFHSK